jgi:hypothetical protein
VVSVRVRYEKTATEENDGRIDVFDLCELYISRTFLETRRSDEVSQLSIKVDELKQSNKVTNDEGGYDSHGRTHRVQNADTPGAPSRFWSYKYISGSRTHFKLERNEHRNVNMI